MKSTDLNPYLDPRPKDPEYDEEHGEYLVQPGFRAVYRKRISGVETFRGNAPVPIEGDRIVCACTDIAIHPHAGSGDQVVPVGPSEWRAGVVAVCQGRKLEAEVEIRGAIAMLTEDQSPVLPVWSRARTR